VYITIKVKGNDISIKISMRMC